MKKPKQKKRFHLNFLLVLFLLLFSHQKASAMIEIGYRAGLFMHAGRLNAILKEYNLDNPWQTFKPVHLGLGGRMVVGAQTESVTYFAGLKWLRNTQTSSGIDPATDANNSKRLVVHYGGIVFGMHTNSDEPLSAGFEINAFNYYVLSFQQSTSTPVKEAGRTEIINNLNPDLSLFARFALQHGMAGVSIIPALDIPLFHGRNDIGDLRTQWNLYPAKEPQIMRGYNLSVTLSVLLAKRKYD